MNFMLCQPKTTQFRRMTLTNLMDLEQVKARLADKILLGTGHWLWGESFSRSVYSKMLRDHLNNGIDIDELIELLPDEKYIAMLEDKKEVDALDNSPHTTIGIFERGGNL